MYIYSCPVSQSYAPFYSILYLACSCYIKHGHYDRQAVASNAPRQETFTYFFFPLIFFILFSFIIIPIWRGRATPAGNFSPQSQEELKKVCAEQKVVFSSLIPLFYHSIFPLSFYTAGHQEFVLYARPFYRKGNSTLAAVTEGTFRVRATDLFT